LQILGRNLTFERNIFREREREREREMPKYNFDNFLKISCQQEIMNAYKLAK
jgi:hypothetical protein